MVYPTETLSDTHVTCHKVQEYVTDDMQENNVTHALFVWIDRPGSQEKVSVYIRKRTSVGASLYQESDWDVFTVVEK
jgi:hypothetical protein